VEQSYHRRDFFRVRREDDRARGNPIRGEAIGLVDDEPVGIGNDVVSSDDVAKASRQVGIAVPPTPETVAAAAALWPTCRGGAVEATDEIIEHVRRLEAAKKVITYATEDKKAAELELWKILGDKENLVYNGKTIATLRQQTRKAHEVKEATFRTLRITKQGKEVL